MERKMPFTAKLDYNDIITKEQILQLKEDDFTIIVNQVSKYKKDYLYPMDATYFRSRQNLAVHGYEHARSNYDKGRGKGYMLLFAANLTFTTSELSTSIINQGMTFEQLEIWATRIQQLRPQKGNTLGLPNSKVTLDSSDASILEAICQVYRMSETNSLSVIVNKMMEIAFLRKKEFEERKKEMQGFPFVFSLGKNAL